MPLNKKVKAITNMKPPTPNTGVCAFMGLTNYYIDMWAKHSHTVKPLTILAPKNVILKWTHVGKKCLTRLN